MAVAGQGRNLGQTIGQAGYQVQDFAVQVAGGTSALTAFGQQAPQLLGIFGTAGIIAGGVVAVGALALKFTAFGEESKKAAEEQKRLTESVQAGLGFWTSLNSLVSESNALLATNAERSAQAANASRAAMSQNAAAMATSVQLQRDAATEQVDLLNRQIEASREYDRRVTSGGGGPALADYTGQEVAVLEARRADEQRVQNERRVQQQLEAENKRTTDSIVQYGAEAFADMWDKNGKGFAGLMDTLEGTFRRTMARMAAEALIRPIVQPIVTAFGGSGGVAGAAGSVAGGGGVSSLSGLSNLYSTGSGLWNAWSGPSTTGISGALNGWGMSSGLTGNGVSFAANSGAASYGGFGVAGEGAVSGALGASTAASWLGGIGGGYAIGSMIGGYGRAG